MVNPAACPECHNPQTAGITCQDHFHTLLFWENEIPAYGEVHHLTVLCYHLQHPSLYSPDGLQYARQLLEDFVARGISPAEERRLIKDRVDSSQWKMKITSRPEVHGAYLIPANWNMIISDVVAAGKENYVASVRAWAESIYRILQDIPPTQ